MKNSVSQISPYSKLNPNIYIKLNILQEKLGENTNEYLLMTWKGNVPQWTSK